MSLMAFIEANWFELTMLFGVACTSWRVAREVNKMKSNIDEKFSSLDDRITESERYRNEDKEREKLIMQGVEATLRTLHSQGANGPVTESLNAIDNYKLNKVVE